MTLTSKVKVQQNRVQVCAMCKGPRSGKLTFASTTFVTSSSIQQYQVDTPSMDFAPIPLQHFGPSGTAISPFDMHHMSNALPDISQQRYIQSLPQAQITQASAIDPNLAYSPYSHQQFAGQLSGQYPPQHLQQSYPQLQGVYSCYSTNMQSNPSELQSHSQSYLPQRQMGYSMNRPR